MREAYRIDEINRMRKAMCRIMEIYLLPGAAHMDDKIHFTTEDKIEVWLNIYITAKIEPEAIEAEADKIKQQYWHPACQT